MICAAIKGPSLKEASQQISQALSFADLVELRLDLFERLNKEDIKALQTAFPIPMIFTLRSRSQGGNYPADEKQRLEDIVRMASLNPEYIDIESDVPSNVIDKLRKKYPQIKIILSHHDFAETPKDLDALYSKMQKIPAHYYKVALQANSSLDALRLLCFAKNKSNIIPISMGQLGQFSRILGRIVGSPMTFASIDDEQQTAPGQLQGDILKERYHYQSLGAETAIYGLIGDPIDQSISDETHNALFQALGLDAVYVKMVVRPREGPEFIALAQQLPFSGLSVTMPLKECFPEYDIQKIGALNTLKFTPEGIFGINTDGIGALNAIEMHRKVKGTRIVIIGAGGVSKAIAYEAQKRGASVVIVNRHAKRAAELAKVLGCHGFGLEHLAACAREGYDILINATPVDLPVDPQHIIPNVIAMDVKTKPKITLFLHEALKKGCSLVHGYEMFVEQALGQFAFWFDHRIDERVARKLLESLSLKILIDRK